jgi:hypothetical protein
VKGPCKYGHYLPDVHKRQAVSTLPECPLAVHEKVCTRELLINDISERFKEGNLYRAVVIVKKVYAVPCSEST